MDIAPLEDPDVEAVIALWNRCGLTRPWNDPHQDIAYARAEPGAEVLVGRRDGKIIAAAMVGTDGHRGYAYYVGVDPALQGEGLGARIMAAAQAWVRARGCPKLHVLVRRSNAKVIGFYERLGFAQEDVVCLGKRF